MSLRACQDSLTQVGPYGDKSGMKAPTSEGHMLQHALHSLLTVLHIQLGHPTKHQLYQVMSWYFYALELNKAIGEMVSSFHQCASLKNSPLAAISQFSDDPPPCCSLGLSFAADVFKRNHQLIFVLCEYIRSHTSTHLISNEQKSMLREAILQTGLLIKPTSNPSLVKRVDPVPGFPAWHHHISIELEHIKNTVAKKKSIDNFWKSTQQE